MACASLYLKLELLLPVRTQAPERCLFAFGPPLWSIW